MFFSFNLSDPHLAALTALIAGGALALWFFSRSSSSSKPWLPYAPVGLLETVEKLPGTKGPFFLLELARKMKSDNFRVPVPVNLKGVYVVSDSKVARQIYADPQADKPRFVYGAFDGLTDRHTLFTSSNTPYMRSLRKGTAHAFSKKEVGRMNDIARKQVDVLLNERFAGIAERGESFDAGYEMTRLTFFVLCEAAMEYTANDEEYDTFSKHSEIALKEFILKQVVNPFRRVLWTLLPGVREARASSKIMTNFTRKVLDAYKNNTAKSKQNTLIKMVSESTACYDEKQTIAELSFWMIAGQDTTGHSISNLLVLLAKHLDVQNKLRETIKGKADPAKVDYYQYVVKEANRLLPVTAMGSGRVVGRDIDIGDYIIPKDAMATVVQFVGNRSESIFEDPDAFKPERWENATQEMKDQIIPFALGSRSCPGQALAMAEIDTTIPRLISEYQLVLDHPGELDYFMTLKYVRARIKPIKLK